MVRSASDVHEVRIDPPGLGGFLGIPRGTRSLVLFAHGSGSGRHSPRNQYVATGLHRAGFGTFLLDLLRPEEETDRRRVFDIDLLAERLLLATRWVQDNPSTATLIPAYFGASTGAAAALSAAGTRDSGIAAVVSRGGRPDLAMDALDRVTAPTLFIVGGRDVPVIGLNQQAYARLPGIKELVIVPGAGHLFEEPGTLDAVVRHATRWFTRFLPGLERHHA